MKKPVKILLSFASLLLSLSGMYACLAFALLGKEGPHIGDVPVLIPVLIGTLFSLVALMYFLGKPTE